MAEVDDAVKLANKVLEDVSRDPDSDLSMLARQFLRAREALIFVGAHFTSDEGDTDKTEEEFGLDASEVVEMAYDNMINRARAALGVTLNRSPRSETRTNPTAR
jgi:hypothetical protein